MLFLSAFSLLRLNPVLAFFSKIIFDLDSEISYQAHLISQRFESSNLSQKVFVDEKNKRVNEVLPGTRIYSFGSVFSIQDFIRIFSDDTKANTNLFTLRYVESSNCYYWMTWSLRIGHQLFILSEALSPYLINDYVLSHFRAQGFPTWFQSEILNDPSFLTAQIPFIIARPETPFYECLQVFQKLSQPSFERDEKGRLIRSIKDFYDFKMIIGLDEDDASLFPPGAVIDLAKYPVGLKAPNKYGFREPIFHDFNEHSKHGLFLGHEGETFTLAVLKSQKGRI